MVPEILDYGQDAGYSGALLFQQPVAYGRITQNEGTQRHDRK
jgi:hypothetical protein